MDQDEKFWRGRNVLVTGCTGLLGSWLTEALVERGAQVVGLIRDQIPHSQLYRSGTIDRIRVVRGALEHYELVHRLLNEYEVDTVFHLADLAQYGRRQCHVALHAQSSPPDIGNPPASPQTCGHAPRTRPYPSSEVLAVGICRSASGRRQGLPRYCALP